MKTVQPIRSITQIKQIEKILKSQSIRDYMLFRLGINSGLRISDILNLKAKDLRNKEYFVLKEQKTGKMQRLKIQSTLKMELDEYLKDMDDEDYVIGSKKYTPTLTISTKIKNESGKSKSVKQKIENTSNNSPLQRMQAWRILNDVARKVGITDPIGCHTMRKSFGYRVYSMCKDITIVQKLLNHSSPQVTLRYIGIIQEDLDAIIDQLNFDYDDINEEENTKINKLNKSNTKTKKSKSVKLAG